MGETFSILIQHEGNHTVYLVLHDELHDLVEKFDLALLHAVHTFNHLVVALLVGLSLPTHGMLSKIITVEIGRAEPVTLHVVIVGAIVLSLRINSIRHLLVLELVEQLHQEE